MNTSLFLSSHQHILIMMNGIKMVDLKGQYDKIKDEVDASIREVIESTAFIKGPQVSQFQEALEDFLGVNHVIACGNGTDALQVALMALDLKPGDEVITTPFTFVATLEVIKLLGLKPVLCDIDPDNFLIDSEKTEKLITPATKLILPVHLFGQCAEMAKINKLASRHNLYVIEDAAQSLGSDYIFPCGTRKKSGTLGTIGCTSFFPSKNLGAWGDGGAIFTNDQELGGKIKAITNHGMKARYYYDYIGVNSRLDTLQAAILNVKLKRLNDYNAARKKAADFYDSELKECPGIQVPARVAWSDHIFHQYTIKTKEETRDELKDYLQKNGIPSMVYYPFPLHLQTAYNDLGYQKGDFPVTEEVCKRVLSLPMHTELDDDQLHFITDTIHSFYT